MSEPVIRPYRRDDHDFLVQMWHTAAFWQPEAFTMSVADALRVSEIARYIDGFPGDGDHGLIATIDDERAGAAWWRTFTSDEPGYGFVDERTPELAIAVVPQARGRGIATALMHALIGAAQDEGLPGLSLSVNHANPSRRIYERGGFVEVSRDDDSAVMVLRC